MSQRECKCSETYIAMAGPCLSCPLFGCQHEYSHRAEDDPDICLKCGHDRTEDKQP